MSTTQPEPQATQPALVRDTERGELSGVLAGFARRFGVDVTLLRVLFVVSIFITGGLTVVAYLFAWAVMPVGEGQPARPEPRWRARPQALDRLVSANWRVAAGVGLLTLAFLLVLRELGIWWSDAVIWPAILAASGAALLWRQSQGLRTEPRSRTTGEALNAPGAGAAPTASRAPRLAQLYRGGFGIALVLGAGLLFLWANGVLVEASEVVLAIVVAATALALILAPFLWRLGRNLAAERAERIRSQERAELAARVHDSVLQTLTLVQKRADDPRAVAQLARRQERELRSLLFGDERKQSSGSVAAALERAALDVEEAHNVPIEVVAVGDARLNERTEALVAAAREAMVNAAKFAPDAGEVAVYAELGPERAEVYVRDRGPGFDPELVPPDRRGVRESIVGRMERFGGSARIRSRPGAGTEVELVVEVE